MTETKSVIIEREIAFPADKIWRALTQPHLIEEWLMKGDFKLEIGRKFRFTEDWGSIDCQVLTVEPNKTLAYSWAAFGLNSVVTFTLTPTASGTSLRIEQSGFVLPDMMQAFAGANAAWPTYLTQLEAVVGKME